MNITNAIIHPGKDGVRLSQMMLQKFIPNSTIINTRVESDLFGQFNFHKEVYDTLLISCMTSRDIWSLPDLIKKWRNKTKKIIVGGLAARQLSKNALNYIDCIVIGNVFSENVSEKVLNSYGKIYLEKEKLPIISIGLPVKNRINYFIIRKIECMNQCKYCCGPVGSDCIQDEDIIRLAKEIKKPINIFSPDGDISLDLYKSLIKNRIKLKNTNFTAVNAIRLIEAGMKMTIRVGIEGFSRKTRKELGREIDDECLSILMDRPAVHFNLIAGIPGESYDDYLEFYEKLSRAKSGHTLTITPLEWSPFWRYGNNTAPEITWKYIENFNSLLRKINCWSRKTRTIEDHREIERMNGSCPFS